MDERPAPPTVRPGATPVATASTEDIIGDKRRCEGAAIFFGLLGPRRTYFLPTDGSGGPDVGSLEDVRVTQMELKYSTAEFKRDE